MALFDFFKKKKVELTDGQKKWNKMWEMWAEGTADLPYEELMTYQAEINNGGHYQYFVNVENIGDLQKDITVLETILPEEHKQNLKKAYEAYLLLEEKEDEQAELILEQCDELYYENEEVINHILEDYAATIQL